MKMSSMVLEIWLLGFGKVWKGFGNFFKGIYASPV